MTDIAVSEKTESTVGGGQSGDAAPDPQHLLKLYLRDHDAASAGGLQLLRRSCASNADTPFGPALERLLADVEEDAAALHRIAGRLDVGRDPLKRAVAKLSVVMGGLKLNARMVRYSPLSRVYELEGLMAGVRAKRALWRALALAASVDGRIDAREVQRLEGRADEQLRTLDELHARAVPLAFGESR